MRVFRRRSSLGCLTLLAAAMQVVLAVAHTHAHTHFQMGAGSLAARAITFGACRAGSEQPCIPSCPHDDRAKCATCLSVSLASAAVLNAPPAVPVLPQRIAAPLPFQVRAFIGGGESVHFQARAPPLPAQA
jgi:hypothetical protein